MFAGVGALAQPVSGTDDPIARMLQRLLQQRSRLPAMGVAARKHAEEAFGLPRFVERTEAVYRQLLATR